MPPSQFRTRFSDDEIVQALRTASTAGAARADAPDRLAPPNLCAFFNNLPTPERERLLDLVYPKPPKPARPRRAAHAKQVASPPDGDAGDGHAAPESTAPVDIGPATAADLPAVYRVDQSAFAGGGFSYDAATLRQLLDVAQENFLVARRGPAVVGYTVGLVAADRQTAWVLCLAVAPDARRRGVGLALGHALIERLRHTGARAAALTVHPDNNAARALYRQLGFGEHLVDPNYFGGGQPRVVMRLEW